MLILLILASFHPKIPKFHQCHLTEDKVYGRWFQFGVTEFAIAYFFRFEVLQVATSGNRTVKRGVYDDNDDNNNMIKSLFVCT